MTTIMMTMVVMVMIIVVFITMVISLVQCTLLCITLVRVVVDTCPQVILLRLFAHFHPGASFACVSFGGKCNFARLSSSGRGCQLFEIGDCHSSSTHSVFYYLFPRDDKLGRNLKKH